MNFPDKEQHPVFVEPEGVTTQEVYLQGLTTSLPVFVQEMMIQATPGLENARLVRPGYAVEYDYLPPQQLTLGLQSKDIAGLFSAGQLNGTSGYEEAAAQGLMAGINAALYARDEAPFILRRDQAYIGVLVDDLVTKGVDEPYRMFTSRAEYRLLLRHDNAADRLSHLGHSLGLIDDGQVALVEEKQRKVAEYAGVLERAQVRPNADTDRRLRSLGTRALEEPQSATRLLRRPQVDFATLLTLLAPTDKERMESAPPEVIEQLDLQAAYEGYIQRQAEEIRKQRATENVEIPHGLDYNALSGLTREARDKLERVSPETLGQASRIPGVSPADISVLLIHVHRAHARESGRRREVTDVFHG
jgi:tRNA uridine 5-carboxymethylaminomethyl modification enzyme